MAHSWRNELLEDREEKMLHQTTGGGGGGGGHFLYCALDVIA